MPSISSINFAVELIFPRAVAVAVGQSVLVNSLVREVPKHTSAVPPEAVIANGALNLQRLTDSSVAQRGLREAYAKAIQNLIIYSLVAVCIALPFALSMQWLNVKNATKKPQSKYASGLDAETDLGTEMQATSN